MSTQIRRGRSASPAPGPRVGFVLLIAFVAAMAALGDDAPSPVHPSPSPQRTNGTSRAASGSPTATPFLDLPPLTALPNVTLTRIATMTDPLGMAVRRGDDAIYIAEKSGTVRAMRDGKVDPVPVLDLSNVVSRGGEQGLLGIAFSPDGTSVFVDFTDRSNNVRIRRYDARAKRWEPASAVDVLVIPKPFAQHNGGQLVFGPDGDLWISVGDGGSAGDPFDNAQSLQSLLGKILRIDPRPLGSRPYRIPADNPFVSKRGARGEIWAFGLRNPWRFSFDRVTDDLWISDVGQDAWEEVNFEAAGSKGARNYGWNRFEGQRRFIPGPLTGPYVGPLATYANGKGACAVTGGYVYRGQRIPGLVGTYVFGDFCDGRLRALTRRGGSVLIQQLSPRVDLLSSFGEDANGELYVFSLAGGVYRLEPASGATPESGRPAV
jgi:glucose/arabinose dehydrogenase